MKIPGQPQRKWNLQMCREFKGQPCTGHRGSFLQLRIVNVKDIHSSLQMVPEPQTHSLLPAYCSFSSNCYVSHPLVVLFSLPADHFNHCMLDQKCTLQLPLSRKTEQFYSETRRNHWHKAVAQCARKIVSRQEIWIFLAFWKKPPNI